MSLEYDNNVVIAIDYDGTLTKRNGELDARALRWIKRMDAKGMILILWSCRDTKELPLPRGVPLIDAQEYTARGESRKLNADIYIDNLNPLGPLWTIAYIKAVCLQKKRHANEIFNQL